MPITLASGPSANLPSTLEVSGTLGAAVEDSGCTHENSGYWGSKSAFAPTAAPLAAWSAVPSLNLSSLSAIFAVPPNGSVVLRSLLITGALLPASPFPLPAASFLALSAFKLPASRGAGSAPPLQLSDLLLATPFCVALSLHQDFACRASPSPNFTVTPSSLIVHRYTTPAASITNVTLVCTGAPAPFPCLATSASSVEGILAPARYMQNLVATGAWPLAGIMLPPVYVHLCGDILFGRLAAVEAESRPVLSSLQLVIAGDAGAGTVLDLADAAGLFQIVPATAQVQLHNLTIRNPPLGPLYQRPWSLLRAMLWAFQFNRLALGAKSARLLARSVRIELPPAELAYWFATALGRKAVPPELRGSFCAEGLDNFFKLQGARAIRTTSGTCVFIRSLETSQTQDMKSITLCGEGEVSCCGVNASAADYGINSHSFHPPDDYTPEEEPSQPPAVPARSADAGGWPVSPGLRPGVTASDRPEPSPSCVEACVWRPPSCVEAGLRPGVTASLSRCTLCQLNPEGVSGVTALAYARLIASNTLPNDMGTRQSLALSHAVLMLKDYDASIYGRPEQMFMVADRFPAALTAPAVLLGDYLQPLALDVGRLPAAIALRTANASFTARAVTLVNLPPAGLYPTMDLVPDTPGFLNRDRLSSPPPEPYRPPPALQTQLHLLWRRQLSQRDSLSWLSSPHAFRSRDDPGDSLQRAGLTATQARRRGGYGGAARGAASRRLLQAGEAFPAETQGLPLGLANFTSCVWTLDFGVFSRRAAAGTLGPPALPAEAPQLDPPRVFLDSVTLLVPLPELQLLAWCAAHNSTAVVTDPWVAQELAALLRDSELMRPDVVRQLTAAAVESPEGDAASRQLANITFSRFRWCGLQGRNVTLASRPPYVAREYLSSFELPVRWEWLQPARPADAPEVPCAAGSCGPVLPAGVAEAGKGGADDGGGTPGMPAVAGPPPPASSGGNTGAPAEQQEGSVQDPAAPVQQLGSAAKALERHTHVAAIVGACSAAGGVTLLLGLALGVYNRCSKARLRHLQASAPDSDAKEGSATVNAGAVQDADDDLVPAALPDAQPPTCYDEEALALPSSVTATVSTSLQDAGCTADGGGEKQPHTRQSAPASPAVALQRIHCRIQQLQGALISAEGHQSARACGSGLHSPQTKSSLLPSPAFNLFCESPGGSYYTAAPSSSASPPPSGKPAGPAAQSAMAPALVLSGVLGRGAQGVVYAGTWRGLDVAVKSVLLRGQPGDQRMDWGAAVRNSGVASGSELVSNQDAHQPSLAQRAVAEAAIAASVSHPNVVACYTFELRPLREDNFAFIQPALPSSASMGTTGPARGSSTRLPRSGADPRVDLGTHAEPEAWSLLLVMERCNAGSLRDFLASCAAGSVAGSEAAAPDAASVPAMAPSASGAALPAPASPPASCLSATLLVRLALHVARGMAYLHSRCVVHGDLSSSNVLLQIQQPRKRKASSAHAGEGPRSLHTQTPSPPTQESQTRMHFNPWWAATVSHSQSLGLNYSFSLPLDLSSSFSLPQATGLGLSKWMHEAARLASQPQQPSPFETACPTIGQCSSENASSLQESGAIHQEGAWTVRQGLVPQLQMRRLTAKLCDFGLSSTLPAGGASADVTHVTGSQRRSSLYSAPELVREGHSGYKQDVYAFGVLLWELACGAPLPDLMTRPAGRPVREWLRGQAAPGALVRALPPELLTWPEGIPRELRTLVERCVQEEPSARPNFREICAALGQATEACDPIQAL